MDKKVKNRLSSVLLVMGVFFALLVVLYFTLSGKLDFLEVETNETVTVSNNGIIPTGVIYETNENGETVTVSNNVIIPSGVIYETNENGETITISNVGELENITTTHIENSEIFTFPNIETSETFTFPHIR